MQADHAGHVGAAARQFEDGRATETESEGADLAGLERQFADLCAQRGHSFVDARAQRVEVAVELADLGARLVGVGRPHAFAVHVGNKNDVADGGNPLCLFHRGFVFSHPVRHHDQARPQRCGTVVIDEVPGHDGVADGIADRLDHHCGVRAWNQQEQEYENRQDAHRTLLQGRATDDRPAGEWPLA